MASKITATAQDEEAADRPLLDLMDVAATELVRSAKKRGYVTEDQLSALQLVEGIKSEQDRGHPGEVRRNGRQRRRERLGRSLRKRRRPARSRRRKRRGRTNWSKSGNGRFRPKSRVRDPAERTDDPVRMYLREMGSVELLSREGEIAIAKRIEAGREAMIAGLCESPLAFQAIIIWRDELNKEQILPARHHRPRCDLRRP